MDDDPGWHVEWKSLPMLLFVPQLARRRVARSPDPLATLRNIFIAFCGSMIGVGVVVVIVGDVGKGAHPATVPTLVVFGAGCVTLVLPRLLARPLDCSSAATLASSYRRRFFLRLAFAESAALVGFVVDIQLGPFWVFFVGLGFTAIGFSILAPTRRHLRDEAEALTMSGCGQSLIAALRTPGEPDAAANRRPIARHRK